MHIAVLTELFPPHVGGTEFRLYEIGKRLVRRGHEVDVFTIQYPPETLREENIDGITVHRYARSSGYVTSNGSRSIRGVFAYAVRTALKAIGSEYDIYYFGQWPIFHSLLTAPFVSPCVQEWCEVWYRKIVPFEKALATTMGNHVAVSDFTKRRMVEFLHFDPNTIAVIPNGVDHEKFTGASTNQVWGRLVYVGRVAPHKGLTTLIDAWKIARREAPEVELFIAGSGPLLPQIKEYAKGLEGVQVLGEVSEEEKIALLKSSWLFIMPSSREGHPLAPLEAMAQGVPVLTVDHPDNGVKAICSEGNGVIVRPDSASIASAVLALLRNEHEWRTKMTAALEYAKRCDWETTASQMEEYLSSIACGA